MRIYGLFPGRLCSFKPSSIAQKTFSIALVKDVLVKVVRVKDVPIKVVSIKIAGCQPSSFRVSI
jgi:hypothetical protein